MTDLELQELARTLTTKLQATWPRLVLRAERFLAEPSSAREPRIPGWFRRVEELRQQGWMDFDIANRLNEEGFRTAQRKLFDARKITSARWRWRKLGALKGNDA